MPVAPELAGELADGIPRWNAAAATPHRTHAGFAKTADADADADAVDATWVLWGLI